MQVYFNLRYFGELKSGTGTVSSEQYQVMEESQKVDKEIPQNNV